MASPAVSLRGSAEACSPKMRQPGSRADESSSQLYAGILAADRPGPARLGAAFARHFFECNLPRRRRLDRGDVVHHRRHLLPRCLWRCRQCSVLSPGRRRGVVHFRDFQHVQRRIPAAQFFRLQAACAAHHPTVERHHDLPADARLPRAHHGGLFAWLDRAVLCCDACRACRPALPHRADHRAGARRRIDFRAPDFPDRNRRAYRQLRASLRAVDAWPQRGWLPLSDAAAGERRGGGAAQRARSRPRRGGGQRAQSRTRRDLSPVAVVGHGSSVAPRPSLRFRSRFISRRSRSCTNSRRSSWPRSARSPACN